MARRPAFREEIQLVARSGSSGEQVYLVELAQFLGIHRTEILKLARRMGLFHAKEVWRGLPWVTPYGAKRIIAYVRAYQEHRAERGYNGFRMRAKDQAYKARQKALRAKSLAIPSAGTDAEHPAERAKG